MWIYFLGHIMQPIPLNKDFLLNEKKTEWLQKISYIIGNVYEITQAAIFRAFLISSMNLCRLELLHIISVSTTFWINLDKINMKRSSVFCIIGLLNSTGYLCTGEQ